MCWVLDVALGILGCSMWDLAPRPGTDLGHLHWAPGALAAGPPGKSLLCSSMSSPHTLLHLRCFPPPAYFTLSQLSPAHLPSSRMSPLHPTGCLPCPAPSLCGAAHPTGRSCLPHQTVSSWGDVLLPQSLVTNAIDLSLPQAGDSSRGQRWMKIRKENERETNQAWAAAFR